MDDALKILDRYYLWHYEESLGEYVTVDKEIEDKIKALKAVNMARWIERGHSVVCSVCGEGKWKAYIPSVLIAHEWMKYCPQCGEKMEQEKKSRESGEQKCITDLTK